MTKLNEIYKCSICGNIAEMVHTGVGEMVCCGKEMNLQIENTIEASFEKHIPVIEKTEIGVRVNIGAVAHPMTEEHFIEWVEILADGRVYRKYLQPGDEPTVEFCIKADNVNARAYCNLHGLWKS